tara:strand:- start:1205 stop:2122 length:918 start_codon:yes stop_codon:yes gene_type:complete
MNKCKICGEGFSSDRSFHAHLKKHGMYQAEYYCKYYPRYSLHYKKQIPFTNKKEYFDKEFIDLNEFLDWETNADNELVKSKCLEMISRRIDEKEYKYAPFHNELKTLNLPPIDIFKKHFKSYTKACLNIDIEVLFNKPMPIEFYDDPPEFEILIDTREQDPLPFKKSKKEKLYVGDYLNNHGEYTYTYIDRKSEGDFLGTLASGVDRFEREIEKAIQLESYLFVVIETTIDKIKSNHKKFRRKTNLEYVFHNMRHLTHKYPRNIQFIFTGDRKKSLNIIPKLLHLGDRLWSVDIQYYLDNELGSR